MSGTLTIDLVGCARCHGDGHDGLVFSELQHPIEVVCAEGDVWQITHWATCPATGEPIVMRIVDNVIVDDGDREVGFPIGFEG